MKAVILAAGRGTRMRSFFRLLNYVPKKGIAEFGYVLRQLLPGLSFMTFGLNAFPGNANK